MPADVVNTKMNSGTTLLYYTGLTRLAKNILQQIVGGYLDGDSAIMQTLAEEHQVARKYRRRHGAEKTPQRWVTT